MNHNLFESITESVSQGIAVLDQQGRVTYLNSAIKNLTITPPDRFISNKPWEVSESLKSLGVEEMTRRALAGEAVELEFPHPLGDRDRRIRVDVNPLISDDGESKGAVVVMSDLTEVMSLRDQVAAIQKMDALGTLAGGIAHDMNNILTAAQGYLQLIELSLSAGDFREVSAHSKEMRSALARAGDLVKQIMTFSRGSKHDPQLTQIRPLVNDAVKLLRAGLPPNIEIEIDSGGADSVVMADPTRLRQVMLNLGANASHAMERSGGTLTVSVDTVAPSTAGRFVVISFRDTGIGISKELQTRIFEPFFTTKQPGRGTGLGLSVVYGIVSEIGGVVEVDSVEGRGTEVRVFLPEHVMECAETFEPHSIGSARVLFVDDEECLRELGAISLERLGHSVVSCANGETAINMFTYDPERFDVVVTDHIMPRLLGHQLGVQMRVLRPDIPIVIATGTGEDYTQQHAEAAGFHYLAKPYTFDQIGDCVARCLSEKIA